MVNGSNVAVPSSLPDYRIVTEERSTEYMYNGSEIGAVIIDGIFGDVLGLQDVFNPVTPPPPPTPPTPQSWIWQINVAPTHGSGDAVIACVKDGAESRYGFAPYGGTNYGTTVNVPVVENDTYFVSYCPKDYAPYVDVIPYTPRGSITVEPQTWNRNVRFAFTRSDNFTGASITAFLWTKIDDVNLRGASIWVGSVSANATNEYINLPSGVDLCFRIYNSGMASIFVLSKDAPDVLSINLDNVSDYQFISGNVD